MKKTKTKPDTSHRENAVCPWCGKEHYLAVGSVLDGVEFEIRCQRCLKLFHVTRHVTVTYTTRKVEPK